MLFGNPMVIDPELYTEAVFTSDVEKFVYEKDPNLDYSNGGKTHSYIGEKSLKEICRNQHITLNGKTYPIRLFYWGSNELTFYGEEVDGYPIKIINCDSMIIMGPHKELQEYGDVYNVIVNERKFEQTFPEKLKK